jgi:hypothetical protein
MRRNLLITDPNSTYTPLPLLLPLPQLKRMS